MADNFIGRGLPLAAAGAVAAAGAAIAVTLIPPSIETTSAECGPGYAESPTKPGDCVAAPGEQAGEVAQPQITAPTGTSDSCQTIGAAVVDLTCGGAPAAPPSAHQ